MRRDELDNMTETAQEELILELQINLATNETTAEGLEQYFRECEDWYESIEDDILDDLYNGNWTDGANKMLENYITPNNLIDWLEEQREELGEEYHSHFDLGSAVSITELYNRARLESA